MPVPRKATGGPNRKITTDREITLSIEEIVITPVTIVATGLCSDPAVQIAPVAGPKEVTPVTIEVQVVSRVLHMVRAQAGVVHPQASQEEAADLPDPASPVAGVVQDDLLQ